MNELPARNVTILDPFWSPKLEINAKQAIFHQWRELEKSGCIDNFRIVSGEKQGFREGWVFADSDAYKWLEAAARIYARFPDLELKRLMDDLIALLARTHLPDGYIYTFNQFHFQGQRWVNMQIEHELYCLGHLIEAGVSHFEATQENSAIKIARQAADLLVTNFLGGPPSQTDGHQEIEIALLRLYAVTRQSSYLELAQHFIEARGQIPFFGMLVQKEISSHTKRKAIVGNQRTKYAQIHPEYAVTRIPPDNESINPPFSKLRRRLSAWNGSYYQQHIPVRQQTIPVGHAVRYGYFQTATTMLHRISGDASLLPALQQSWERMVSKRMYVTGGLGSLPGNEGFGNDYELNPEYAYNETCAALASLFWNWEMSLTTQQARYDDLFEWQLYNAAAVGMGINGDTYLYNNPLAVRATPSPGTGIGGFTRKAWYSVPCCPSNLSRTWAGLGRYIYSFDEKNVWIHQYIGNKLTEGMDQIHSLKIDSLLPFDGTVIINIESALPTEFSLNFRIPSWCLATPTPQGDSSNTGGSNWKIYINDELCKNGILTEKISPFQATAQGYDPRLSFFLKISRIWNSGDIIRLEFDMPILFRKAHPAVKNHRGKLALTRGPLVYCLETTDNPEVDIFATKLDIASLLPEIIENKLGKITVLRGKSTQGQDLTFIPYHLWANRGASQMNVWVNG